MRLNPLSPRQLACALGACIALSFNPALANGQVGAWQAWNTLPFFPVHAHMLPSGQVMIWPGDAGINGDNGRLLDPSTQNLSGVPLAGYDLFCSGHSFLPNGDLLVAGGHIVNNVGLARASRYGSFSNTWTAVPDMNAGRWYPTVTTLPNGDALVVSGSIDLTIGANPLPQVYQLASNTWRNLSTAQLSQPLYPMMFVAPNGRVIDVAPSQVTRWLDTSGTGEWSTVASRKSGDRDAGTAVMYEAGKILVLGGGDPPLRSAEVIDLNQPSPAWRSVGRMSVARRHVNATLLPDGKVLVTGGTSGAGFNDMSRPVFQSELWDPATENFTPVASATVPRLYHSAATLLPDGRVLATGGNEQLTPEVYSPPYLFKGERPSISSAPDAIDFGQRFAVQTPQAAAIAKVTLIRMTSVTHSFNENQRLNVLAFERGSTAVDITAPASGNIAPPGHYLLFLVDSNGVPSLGKVVQLTGDAPAPPPPAEPPYQLAVTKAGQEARRGTVTSSPAGINCGNTCTAPFARDSQVTLTAKAVGQVRFVGWGGACTDSTSTTCTVTMEGGDKAVTANFARR